MREEWQNAERIVIKIGSSLLVDEQKGNFRTEWLLAFAEDITQLYKDGKQIVLVSSGAKALGRQELNFGNKKLALNEAQAAAAVGQISLSAAYKALFKSQPISVAQILLTPDDTEDRRRFLNARDTINTLLELGTIPVVNENDTITTEELRYGDNDRLAARVAAMIEADVLMILSDIDGLYTTPPKSSQPSEHLDVIQEITPEIEAMAGGSGSSLASGGMVTKIEAAKIANASGCHMVITSGKGANPITAFLNGGKASWFLSSADPVQSRKSWIRGSLDIKGTITIDKGAETALKAGKSLLPAGVTAITGTFNRGDIIAIKTETDDDIAVGMSSYTSEDADKIIGKQSSEIEEILGYSGRSELIHRDNMALTKV